MMAAASDNSNRNGSTTIEMGGAERIASILIIRLLLVPVPLFFFSICYWRLCVLLVCVPSH